MQSALGAVKVYVGTAAPGCPVERSSTCPRRVHVHNRLSVGHCRGEAHKMTSFDAIISAWSLL